MPLRELNVWLAACAGENGEMRTRSEYYAKSLELREAEKKRLEAEALLLLMM